MKRTLAFLLILAVLLSFSTLAAAEGAGELRTVSVLAEYPTILTPEQARSMPMYEDFEAIFAAKGIKIEFTYVDSDQYTTVLQALISSNEMPDVFVASRLGSASCINLVNQGKILAVDDILAYSDGTATYALSEEGYMYPCREKDTFEDGKLWYLGQASMLASVDSQADNFGYNAVTSNTYAIKVRQDWLDVLEMEAPTTLDEFFDMLVAFQENDMNGNGVADERLVIPLATCNTTWGGLFDNGIASWFGLAPYVFQLNRETWEAEVPFLQEGFVPYVQFLRRCIEAGVIHLSDNVGKNNAEITSALAQDIVSAYFYQSQTDMAGAPDEAVYVTLGKIVGEEGIVPVMDGSRGWKAWDLRGFRNDMDPQLAADFLDIVTSIEWSVFWNFGVEGKSYEILESGLYDFTAPTDKAEYLEYGYTDCYNLLGDGRLPRTALNGYFMSFNGESLIWDSYEEFLGSDYFSEYYIPQYKEHAIENVRTWCSMAEELQKFNMNGDLTMIAPMTTSEEADILDMYETDLYTYMDELFANLLSGAWSLDNYDAPYLSEALSAFRGTDTTIACEDIPLNKRQLERFEKILKPRDRFGVLLDAGHMNIRQRCMELIEPEDFITSIEALPLPIVELHLHDNKSYKDEHKHLGYGNLPLDAIVIGLKRKRFDGYVTIEIVPREETEEQAFQYATEGRDLFLQRWQALEA
ncbi:extracellular solute-binding protein [Eubacteriales bacterium OttesenSCG-928-A19]|nr:extracellular solute-binding protein [Eubacteriales bacterium OttesenSCG-928-A19]